jgi:hypothetical protein
MFSEGDLVEYSKHLHFVIALKPSRMVVICPVNKIELFGTETERLKSIVKNSFEVYDGALKLNETGRLEEL